MYYTHYTHIHIYAVRGSQRCKAHVYKVTTLLLLKDRNKTLNACGWTLLLGFGRPPYLGFLAWALGLCYSCVAQNKMQHYWMNQNPLRGQPTHFYYKTDGLGRGDTQNTTLQWKVLYMRWIKEWDLNHHSVPLLGTKPR